MENTNQTAAPAATTTSTTSTSTTAVIQRRLDLILSQVLLKLDLVIQRDLTKLNKQIATKQATTTTTTVAKQNPRQITPPFLASICLESADQPPAKRRIEEDGEQVENKSDAHTAQRRRKSESLDDEHDDLIIILEHSSNEPSSSQHPHYPLQSLPSFTNKTTAFRIPPPPITPPTLSISSTQSINPKLSPPAQAPDHLPSQFSDPISPSSLMILHAESIPSSENQKS
jgi:hypothetical protein